MSHATTQPEIEMHSTLQSRTAVAGGEDIDDWQLTLACTPKPRVLARLHKQLEGMLVFVPALLCMACRFKSRHPYCKLHGN